MSTREQIITAFKSEFKPLQNKFEIVDGHAGAKPAGENVNKPGVYVFYHGDEIWKVGKSNTDAYVRSRQHFQDGTGSSTGFGMKQYAQDENMKYLLFVLPDGKDVHWAYALEYFLETHFRSGLRIRSVRR